MSNVNLDGILSKIKSKTHACFILYLYFKVFVVECHILEQEPTCSFYVLHHPEQILR